MRVFKPQPREILWVLPARGPGTSADGVVAIYFSDK